MTFFQDYRSKLFGKLFHREEAGSNLKEYLPWCYTVEYVYYSDDSDVLRSGSQSYLGSESDLGEEAAIKWYLDNEHIEGEIVEVSLSLNRFWKDNPSYKA